MRVSPLTPLHSFPFREWKSLSKVFSIQVLGQRSCSTLKTMMESLLVE